MNRSFSIDPVTFDPGYEEPPDGVHGFGTGHFTYWQCKLCKWKGRTTPHGLDTDHVQLDAQRIAGQHGYGRCVP